MREVRKFIANDGTEFEDFHECVKYELFNEIDDVGNDLQLYNNKQEPCSNPDHAYYIIARTPSAKELLKKLCEFYDASTPWDRSEYLEDTNSEDANAWWWDNVDKEWYSFNYLCEQARKLNDKVNCMGTWLTL